VQACIANEEFDVPESQVDQAKLLLEVQKENQQLRMQIGRLQQKVFSVKSQALTSSPSPIPPSPLTPSNIIPMSDRHRPKNLQCYNIEPTPRDEFLINHHGNTVKETIRELRRNIQGLQEESKHVKAESSMKEKRLAMKEKQLTNSLMALSLEHSV